MRSTVLLVLICLAVGARGQERPVSFHTRALVTQYYATNRGDWADPADAFFFAPSLGGAAEAMVRWRPDSTRLFFEAGVCGWAWHYRTVLNRRTTGTQYGHAWAANSGGLSLGIPFRAGIHIRQMFSLAAGVVVLRNVSSPITTRQEFQSSVQGEDLAAEYFTTGRRRTSVAFDLTAGFQLSQRLDVVLRGSLDTSPYPTVDAHHYITRGGLTRQYIFSGAPKLASVGIGLGYLF